MAYNLMTEPSEYKAYNEGYEQGVADTEFRWRNSNNRAYNKALEDFQDAIQDDIFHAIFDSRNALMELINDKIDRLKRNLN